MNIELLIVLLVSGISLATIGVFLVLKGLTMIVEAIAHAVLLGIVIAFFIFNDLQHPSLLIGATLVGLLIPVVSRLLAHHRLIGGHEGSGIIYPLFFSVAILLISVYRSNSLLSINSVFFGRAEFATMSRLVINGVDLGPTSLYLMGVTLVLNIVFVILFNKELQITTFDKTLAIIGGFSPVIIYFLLMGLVTFSLVGAFSIYGSILVISYIITPIASARLLTNRYKLLIPFTVIIAVSTTVITFIIADSFSLSLAPVGAVVNLVTFLIFLIVSPSSGFIKNMITRRSLRKEFLLLALLVHLANHEKENHFSPVEAPDKMIDHLHWSRSQLDVILSYAKRESYLKIVDDNYVLEAKAHLFIYKYLSIESEVRHEQNTK